MQQQEYDIGETADFPPGRPHPLEVGGQRLVVVHGPRGFYALRDRCPHQGAPLSAGRLCGVPRPCAPGHETAYGREGEILVCPWHGWSFDTHDGRPLVPSGRRRVRSYPVEERHGRLVVSL